MSSLRVLPFTIAVLCLLAGSQLESQSSTIIQFCSVQFNPVPADNKYKADLTDEALDCLDDVALNLQRGSVGRVIIVATIAASEEGGVRLAQNRAIAVFGYLKEKRGIESGRIVLKTGVPGKAVAEMFGYPGHGPVPTEFETLVPRTKTFEIPQAAKRPQ